MPSCRRPDGDDDRHRRRGAFLSPWRWPASVYVPRRRSHRWPHVLLIIAGGTTYSRSGPHLAFSPHLLPANVAAPAIEKVHFIGVLSGLAVAYIVGVLGGGTRSEGTFKRLTEISPPFQTAQSCTRISAASPFQPALSSAAAQDSVGVL